MPKKRKMTSAKGKIRVKGFSYKRGGKTIHVKGYLRKR